jgi:hypothetical protein
MAVQTLPALQEQQTLAVAAAVRVLPAVKTAALAALASSSSVTHSVWHKDFK